MKLYILPILLILMGAGCSGGSDKWQVFVYPEGIQQLQSAQDEYDARGPEFETLQECKNYGAAEAQKTNMGVYNCSSGCKIVKEGSEISCDYGIVDRNN